MGLILIGFQSLSAVAQSAPPLDGPNLEPIIQLPPYDGGVNPAGADVVSVRLTIGDPSGSASESWRLHVGDVELTAPEGAVVSQVFTFEVGASYPISVEWVSTNLQSPDYDYLAEVAAATGETHPIGVNDPQNLLGEYYYCDSFNCAEGKQATLYVPGPRLKAVSFGGAGHHPVIRDISQIAYEVPQWLDDNDDGDADDAGDHKSPICYVQGSTMTVTEVRIAIDPPAAAAEFAQEVTEVVGRAGNQNLYVFTGTPVLQGNELVATNLTASNPLADRIEKFENGITWYVMLDGGGSVRAGRSDSVLYVTRDAPSVPTLFHTLLEIGCTGANGLTSTTPTQQVVDAIWGVFATRNVMRAEIEPGPPPVQVQLKYYYGWDCTNTTAADMLADPNGDGQCGAWAKLFIETLAAQGVTFLNEYCYFFYISPYPNDQYHFMVNNWSICTVSPCGAYGTSTYPYIGIRYSGGPNQGRYTGTPPNQQYNWAYTELTDQPGVAGQGQPNPASMFANHQVVNIGAVYYDPSYGLTYTGTLGFDAACSGVGRWGTAILDENVFGVDINGNGTSTDTQVATVVDIFDDNPSNNGNQFLEVLIDYP